MAVDRAWLERTRQNNRQRMGMAGLGGLGQVARLRGAFNAPPPTSPRTGTPLPELVLPEAPRVPRAVLYGGGVILLGLVGLVVFSALKRRKS